VLPPGEFNGMMPEPLPVSYHRRTMLYQAKVKNVTKKYIFRTMKTEDTKVLGKHFFATIRYINWHLHYIYIESETSKIKARSSWPTC